MELQVTIIPEDPGIYKTAVLSESGKHIAWIDQVGEHDFASYILGSENYIYADTWKEAMSEFLGFVNMAFDGKIGYYNKLKSGLAEIKNGKNTTTRVCENYHSKL